MKSPAEIQADYPVSSIDMIYKLDAGGCFTYLNPVTIQFFGIREEEVLGRHFTSLLREDFREKVWQFYRDQLERKLPSTYLEFPVIMPNGGEFWIGQSVELIGSNENLEVVAVARDITDRVLATNLARYSEEKYRRIIENINLGLVESDLETRILFANKRFCQMTGYRLSELVGQKSDEILLKIQDHRGHHRVREAMQERRGGLSSAYELQIRRKDGKPLWLNISGAPLRNKLGEVVGALGVVIDVTEQKQDEIHRQELLQEVKMQNIELQARQAYLTALNDFTASLIGDIESEAIIQKVINTLNSGFGYTHCKVYQLDEESNSLRPFAEKGEQSIALKVTGKESSGTAALVRSAYLKRSAQIQNFKASEHADCRTQLAAPIIAGEEVFGVILSDCNSEDGFDDEDLQTFVTISHMAGAKLSSRRSEKRRKQAEQALRNSESKMRTIIHSALDAIITIDESNRITEWNYQAEALFGYSTAEALGAKLSELIIPEKYRHAHEAGLEHFMKTGEGPVLNSRFEIFGQHKEGHYFPIELSIVPIPQGDSYFFTAFIRDITLRKTAEDDMYQALEKQKELSEMKSKLVSMTSHEFRTPLTTVKTNIDLVQFLLQKETLSNKERVAKSMNRIESELLRLNHLMNDILMMGRIESGRVPFRPKPQDIVAFARELIETSFAHQSDGRKVEIVVEGEPGEVWFDEMIYTHVISNLLSNAFKYSVGAENPLLIFSFAAENIYIRVQDHGIGIPLEERDKLFSSFFRASNSEKIQGTGLGLAIVKQFVEMHRGKVTFESEENVGTTFTIVQPRKP